MSNIVGRIWPASWKDYKKKVIEKLRYEHSLRLSWFWGVYQAQSSPLCGVYRLTFGRCLVAINFPEPYFNSGPFTSHWWLIILAIIFHISFTWIFCETSSKGDFLYTLLWSTPRHPWFDYSTGTEYSKPWPWWLLRCRTPNQKFSAWKMYGNSTGSILEQGLLHVDMI